MTSALKKMTKKSIMDNCTKNKLYRTPHLNDVLYLHFQGYNEIENLEEYSEVKCLWLENNAFTQIQGLENQRRLKCLFLQNNLINKIQNLDNCKELDTLNLCHNQIRVIENCGIDTLPVLNTLNISHNFLRTAEQLEGLRNCKFLSVLDISHNRIDDVTVVKILADIPELRVLTMTGNPVVSQIPSYRKTMILECKELTYLDSRPVFPRDRACAEAWKQGGFQAEQKEHRRWSKMDRKKTRDSVNALLTLKKKENGEPVELIKSSSEDEDEEIAPNSAPVDYGDKDNIEKNTLQSWRAIERQVLEGNFGPAEPTRSHEEACNNYAAIESGQGDAKSITLQDIRGLINNNPSKEIEADEKLEVPASTAKPSVCFVANSDDDDDSDEEKPTRQMITWGKKLIEEIEKPSEPETVDDETMTVPDSKPSASTSTRDLEKFPLSIERSHDSIDFPVSDTSDYDPLLYCEQREIGIVEAKNLKNLQNNLKMMEEDEARPSQKASNYLKIQSQCFTSQTTDSLLEDIENDNNDDRWKSMPNQTKIEELLPNESNTSESSSDCDSVREYPTYGPEMMNNKIIERPKSSSAEDNDDSGSSSSTSTEDFFPKIVDTAMNEMAFDSDDDGDGDDEADQAVRGLDVTQQQFNKTMDKWLKERDAADEQKPSTSTTDIETVAPDQASEVWQIDVANNYEIKRFEKKKKGKVSFLIPQNEDEDTVERCRNRLFLIQKLLEWEPSPGLDERSLTVNGEVVVEDLLALKEQRMRESTERLHQLIDRIYARRDEINARFDEITRVWGNFKNPHKLTHSTEALEEIKTTNELLRDAVGFSNDGVDNSGDLPTRSDIAELKKKMECGELQIKGLTVDDLNEIEVQNTCRVVAEYPLKPDLDSTSLEIEDWKNIYLQSPVQPDLFDPIDLRNEDSRVIKAIVSLIIESCVEFNMMHAFQFFNFDAHLTGIVQKYRQRLQKFLNRYNDRKFVDDCLQEWRFDRGSAEEFVQLFGANDGVIDKIKQLIMREYSIDFDSDEEKADHLSHITMTCKQIYKSHKEAIDRGAIIVTEVESNDSDDDDAEEMDSDDEEE